LDERECLKVQLTAVETQLQKEEAASKEFHDRVEVALQEKGLLESELEALKSEKVKFIGVLFY